MLNCYTFYKNRYIFAFQHLPDQIDIVQGKMMGIEKDGIILKTNEERKTYGIASGLEINIPMLK